MAEGNKNLYYIIGAIVVIVVVVLLVINRQPPEEAPPAVPAPAPAPEPEPEPVLPEPEVPTEYVGAELVSNAVCANGKIGAIITNVGEDTVSIGKDLKILMRGLVIKEPGCDKDELAPGEQTTCTTLNGVFPVIDGKNEILIRSIGGLEGKATVTC